MLKIKIPLSFCPSLPVYLNFSFCISNFSLHFLEFPITFSLSDQSINLLISIPLSFPSLTLFICPRICICLVISQFLLLLSLSTFFLSVFFSIFFFLAFTPSIYYFS